MAIKLKKYRGWLGQHGPNLAFQIIGWAFSFLLNPQNLGGVFQKLGWAFERLGHMFWKKKILGRVFWSTDTLIVFDNWSVKRRPYTSSSRSELVLDIFFQFWNFPFSLNLFLFSLPFFFFQILVIKSRFGYFTKQLMQQIGM